MADENPSIISHISVGTNVSVHSPISKSKNMVEQHQLTA